MTCLNGVKPGDLVYVITILKMDIVSSDGVGGYNRSWSSLGSTRSKIKFSSLKDRITGEVLGPAGQATVTIRNSVPMERDYRIELSNGSQYDFVGSSPSMPMSDYKECYFRLVEHEKAEY